MADADIVIRMLLEEQVKRGIKGAAEELEKLNAAEAKSAAAAGKTTEAEKKKAVAIKQTADETARAAANQARYAEAARQTVKTGSWIDPDYAARHPETVQKPMVNPNQAPVPDRMLTDSEWAAKAFEKQINLMHDTRGAADELGMSMENYINKTTALFQKFTAEGMSAKKAWKAVQDEMNGAGIVQKREAEARIKSLKADRTDALRVQADWRRVQFVGRGMVEIAQTFAVASAAGLALMSKAALDYIKLSKNSTDATKEWKIATNSLAVSYNQVGKTVMEAMLPALQLAAKLAKQASDFIQENPQLMTAALNVTGAVVGLSAIGLAVAKGFRIFADVGYILATERELAASMIYEKAVVQQELAVAAFAAAVDQMTGVEAVDTTGNIVGGAVTGTTAATVGAGAAVGGLLLSVATGVAVLTPPLAILVAELAYARANNIDLVESFKQLSTITLGATLGGLEALYTSTKEGIPYIEAAEEAMDKWIVTIGQYLGVINKTPLNPDDYRATFAHENIQMWRDYQKQISDATENYGKQRVKLEQEYEKQRTDIVEQSAEERAKIEADYLKALADLDADYAKTSAKNRQSFSESERKSEDDYQKRRKKLIDDYNIEVARAEEEHQKEMRRLLEDHNIKMTDLTLARDAFGLVQEERSYEIERSRKEEDYQDESRQRREDFERKLAELAQNSADERAQRRAEYAQQQAEARRDYLERKAELAKQHAADLAENDANRIKELQDLRDANNEKLAELKRSYDEQLQTMRTAFLDRIRDIDAAVLGDYAAFQKHMMDMEISFRNWLNSVKSEDQKNPLHKATGGYASRGLYELGEEGREFVLTSSTTKTLERNMGSLSQGGILGMMNGKSGSNIVLNFVLGAGNMSQMKQMVATSKSEILQEVRYALEL